MVTRPKINWILIIQAWAMLWVVIGHSFMTIPFDATTPWYVVATFKFAYSFHMPLFIFVSGYLFYLTRIEKPMAYGKMLGEKIERFGIPFVFLTIVTMALKSVFSDEVARTATFSVQEFTNAILYPNDGPMREFWFLAVIMWMFILEPMWSFLLKCRWTLWGGLGLLIALRYFVSILNPDPLCITRSCHYAIFFYFGLVSCKYKCDSYFTKEENWRIVWLYFCSAILLYVVSYFWTYKPLASLITPLCGIMMSLLLALILDKYLPKIFLSFRDYTYQIYLLGIFFQIGVKILYNKDIISYGGGYVLCVIVGLYSPVLISLIVKKINWHPICLLLGLKSK